MVENEYGFDPDESYTVEDNPFWDATDAAHPAWWRGDDHGVITTVNLINDWLDMDLSDLFKLHLQTNHSSNKLNVLKSRIYRLRKALENLGGRDNDNFTF